MGNKNSGRVVIKKNEELEAAGIMAYSFGNTLTEVAYIMGFTKGLNGDRESVIKKALNKLMRYRNAYPTFSDELEKSAAMRKFSAQRHGYRTAFPTDENGKWVKGDTTMAIFFLKTMFGMRENPDAKELAQALAPLIQFGQKEPPHDASSATPEARTYFDATKETEAS
jgi:hypothetical protein